MGTSDKEPTCQFRRHKRYGFKPWVRKIPWRKAWQSTPILFPGQFHGQKSLVGYSPYRVRHEKSNLTHTHSGWVTREAG